MPAKWTAKRERQYEHIKRAEHARGRSTKRAKAIAAATVNKQRREAGEVTGKAQKRRKARRTKRKSRVPPPSRTSASQRGRASTRRRRARR